MGRHIRNILLLFAIACVVSLICNGCGQARKESDDQNDTSLQTTDQSEEVVKIVQAVTEAPVEITETDVQSETSAPETTAPETTAPETTAPETTAPETTAALSVEEEYNQLYEYENGSAVTMYANDSVNVRTDPTTDEDNVVSSLDKGEEVTVIGETAGWYEIYKDYDTVSGLSELTGFVKKDFLSFSYDEAMAEQNDTSQSSQNTAVETVSVETVSNGTSETVSGTDASSSQAAEQTPETVSTAGGTSIVISSDANIRTEANEVSDVIGVVNAGTTVTKIGEQNGWVQIDYNGTQGYVNANLVG